MLRNKSKVSVIGGQEGKRGSATSTNATMPNTTSSTSTGIKPVHVPSINHHSQTKSTGTGRHQHQQQRNPSTTGTSTSTTGSSTVLSEEKKNFPSVVVASLHQQQPSHNATTGSTVIQNPSYVGIALSPCRSYGVLACKDTIQIVQISAMNGIELIKSIVVTPYFQQQQQPQQLQTKGRNSMGSSNIGGVSSTTSYMYPSSSSASGNSLLNIRDFALSGGSGSGGGTSASINKNKNATTTIQPPLIDTQLIVVTAVAWSNGAATASATNTSTHLSTNDSTGTDSNNNDTETSSVHSKTTTTSLVHNLDDIDDLQQQEQQKQQQLLRTSMIAVAGSNGVIVIWNVATLLGTTDNFNNSDNVRHLKNKSTNSLLNPPLRTTATTATPSIVAQQPSAILIKHVRQVNALAFHPVTHGLLLSASQDCTVIVWEQRKNNASTPTTNPHGNTYYKANHQQQQHGLKGLFGAFGGNQQQLSSSLPQTQLQHSFTWHCRTTFSPKSEAIRDVQWSPIFTDVFALVTGSGSLFVYNQYITARVVVRISAHSSDASTIHWHPTRCNVIATGGDRSVKIWDFEREFEREFNSNNTAREDIMTQNMERNASTGTSRGGESVGTNESSTAAGIDTFSPYGTIGASSMTYGTKTFSSNSAGNMNTSQNRKRNVTPLHVLSISAGVTRIRWRPVANVNRLDGDDLHDSMIAVSTAPIKGANAGGAGTLSLWSFHRPYMPLSVVEGHQDGAVVDFDWLETPQQSLTRQGLALASHELNFFSAEQDSRARIWQHVISVGRDGNCYVQSLVRGDRPICRIPPSCFAMANLSPFQKGYGSLQLFSICQPVPTGPDSDVVLTALRRDRITTSAPGIFCELPIDSFDQGGKSNLTTEFTNTDQMNLKAPWKFCTRIPEDSPQIHFNVVDQGELDEDANPIDNTCIDGSSQTPPIVVAPEVVHLSRFAQRYKLYVDSDCPTRMSLCEHNANIAESLSQQEIANMWRIVALLLESCILSDCADDAVTDDKWLLVSESNEILQCVFLPALKRVLEERADAGDVQTCVVLCEVFAMIRNDQSVLIKDLDIAYIREWYLSYVDLLRDMCLFSYATYIIKHCRDPIINALNQQSTIIHESCPHCGKVMLQDENISSSTQNAASELLTSSSSNARRICKSCRRRVGLCFLCHEPVKGVYVWCPGCGHGGHLDHALQWFGGSSSTSSSTGTSSLLRTMCPTGCGHQCNLMKQVSAFPRTESFS